jgi:defect-in-organelle-trafficking protein DotC
MANMQCLILSLCMAALPALPAQALAVPEAAESLALLLQSNGPTAPRLDGFRAQLIAEAGRKTGFRAAVRLRARTIAQALEARAPELDRLFEFGPLVSESGVLPPVIEEGRHVAAFGVDQIRTADAVYSVLRAERFVSVPPSWRDYLFTGLGATPAAGWPDIEVRPDGADEIAVWRAAASAGWSEGEAQADAILEANFNRLARDLRGMLLYSQLLQQGQATPFTVAESLRAATGDSGRVVVGDRLRRLVGKAGLEPDASRWRPRVQTNPGAGAVQPAEPGELPFP